MKAVVGFAMFVTPGGILLKLMGFALIAVRFIKIRCVVNAVAVADK